MKNKEELFIEPINKYILMGMRLLPSKIVDFIFRIILNNPETLVGN